MLNGKPPNTGRAREAGQAAGCSRRGSAWCPAGVPPCGAPPVPWAGGSAAGCRPRAGLRVRLPDRRRSEPCWAPLVRPSTPWLIALAAGAPTTGTGDDDGVDHVDGDLADRAEQAVDRPVSTVVALADDAQVEREAEQRCRGLTVSPGLASTVSPQGRS